MKRFYLIIMVCCIGACDMDGNNTGKNRPNILFAIADDASYPHMGAYGCNWINTPAFDRVANEGLLFTNAYTPNAKCAPSRACILTGRNSWQLEEAGNHWPYFPDKFKTYAEALAENGYHVGYTTKGLAPGVIPEGRQPTGKPYNAKKLDPPTKYISNSDYTANFEDFLSEKGPDQPFCFWYGSVEPNRKYEFKSGRKLGNKQVDDIDQVPKFLPDNDTIRLDMLDYAYEIEYFDKHLAKMLEILEHTAQLNNTLVLATADNGMPFPRVKSQAYEYSNHLPLAIMWKDGIKSPGRIIEHFVSFIDFTPTFLELANLKPLDAGLQPVTGKSLTPIFKNRNPDKIAEDRDFVLIGKERHDMGRPNDWGYPIRGIVTEDHIYLKNYKPERWPSGNPETGYLAVEGSPTKTFILNERRNKIRSEFWQLSFGKRMQEELYNIKKDPACIHNLALNPEMLAIKKQLEQKLIAKLKEQGDPRMYGNGDIFDQYAYSNEAGRGFYERYMAGDSTLNWGLVNDSDFEKAPLDSLYGD